METGLFKGEKGNKILMPSFPEHPLQKILMWENEN